MFIRGVQYFSQSSEKDIRRGKVRMARRKIKNYAQVGISNTEILCFCNYTHLCECIACYGNVCFPPTELDKFYYLLALEGYQAFGDIYYYAADDEDIDNIYKIMNPNKSNANLCIGRFYAQSGAEESLQTITTFSENVDVSTDLDPRTNVVPTSYDTSLNQFLLRPFILGTFSWSTSDGLGDNIFTIALPQAFYNIPTFQEKIAKFAFWRPSFEITIRVNGTAMHYGRLVACWIPQANMLNSTYKNYWNAFSNRWIQIDANGSNVATLSIPYTSYKDFMNVGYTNIDMATFYTYISVPLNIISGVAPAVTVTIFGRVITPELSGYNFINDWVSQVGTISGIVRNVAGATTGVLKLTGQGAYTPFVKRLSGLVTNVLDYFGLSNPVNIQTTMPIQHRQPLYMKTTDTITSITLAPEINSEVKGELHLLNADDREYDIAYFCGRPALQYTGYISPAVGPGTILYQKFICPIFMLAEDYSAPLDATAYVPTPMAFLSKFFLFWRGSLKFTISFVKSNFHNARVRIMYRPYISSAATIVVPSELQGGDMENIVMDLSNETEKTFIIPFQQQYEWLEVPPVFETDMPSLTVDLAQYCNGFLQLQLINDLTAGIVPMNGIYYQIFVSACEDIEFAMPSLQNLLNTGFIAQVGTTTTVDSVGKPTFCAHSLEGLRECSGTYLGKPVHHLSNFTRNASQVGSILAMVKMLSHRDWFTTNVLGTFNNIALYPSAQLGLRIVGLGADRTRYLNYLGQLMTVFRYWRGGTRVVLMPDQPLIVTSDLQYGFNSSYWGVIPSTTPNYGSGVASWSSTTFHSDTNITPIDVIVPYNSFLNCKLTCETTPSGYEGNVGPFVEFNFPQTVASQISIFTAGADDFRLGFQIGIPLCDTTVPV